MPGVDLTNRDRLFGLRKIVTLPPNVPRAGLALTLGKVSGNYRVYVNGTLVGSEGDSSHKARGSHVRRRSSCLPCHPAGFRLRFARGCINSAVARRHGTDTLILGRTC